MADVFVSYAHEDRARIAPLVTRLETEGWSVWWDRKMVAGDRFEQTIDAAIREARCVIVAWSRAGLASDWVHNEALEGLERKILVPVMLDDVRVPVAFRQSQAARLLEWPAAVDPDELDLLLRGVTEVLGAARSRSKTAASPAVMLDRLRELVARRDSNAAAALASQIVATQSADVQQVEDLVSEVATRYEIHSEPPGARVRVKPYESPQSDWRDLGTTPLNEFVGNGLQRILLELEGHDPAEIAEAIPGYIGNETLLESAGSSYSYPKLIRLQRADPTRPPMVFVPGGELVLFITGDSTLGRRYRIADYFIDRFEVTNADFKRFVDAGGYRNAAYWSHLTFVDGDKTLTFDEVRQRLVDATGRSAPAQWRFGNFPEGDDQLPVTGVSWFEAAAYAKFRGGELPTAAHWNRTAREYLEQVASFAGALVSQSNFGDTLQPVGASPGISAFGAYDMAGNVREWVRNAMGDHRATLGGSHRDADYMFIFNAPLDPWMRDDVTGFRTMRSLGEDDAHVERPIRTWGAPRDLSPVSDDAFAILATQFAYTRSEPRVARTELVTASGRRRHERIELKYRNGSALTLYLTMPDQHAKLQPVLFFPGLSEFLTAKETVPHDYYKTFDLNLIVDSGRALVWPVYHGSNERYANVNQMGRDEQRIYYRDAVSIWRREMGLALDYLATRDDVDADKAALLAVSYGVAYAIPSAVMEDRFKAFVLMHGGLVPWERDILAPVSDMKNYLPRLTKPVFMLNARLDWIFPPECQQALYERLGTPDGVKQRHVHDAGHGYWTSNEMLLIVNWLDETLGRP